MRSQALLFGITLSSFVSSQEEKDKWLEDLNFAISIANSDQIELAEMPLPAINPPSSSSQDGEEDTDVPPSPNKISQIQHRYFRLGNRKSLAGQCFRRNVVGIESLV